VRIRNPYTIESQMNKPIVHQLTKRGIILCGKNPDEVQSSNCCALVTCEECKKEVEKIVDAVFKPLEEST
jgi:hypothetical protein